MNTYLAIPSIKSKSLIAKAKTSSKKYTILLLSLFLVSHPQLKAEDISIENQTQTTTETTQRIDPLILILPNKPYGQGFDSRNLGGAFTTEETTKPILTETIGLEEKIDIYLISEDPQFERCKLVVLDPSGRALFAENIYPIEDNLGQISWPKVTLQLDQEGIHQITGQFSPSNKPPRTIYNSLLVTSKATREPNRTKDKPVLNKQLLDDILTELAYYEPPKDTKYTRAKVLKAIKDFFNNNDPRKQNYRTKELELVTNWIKSGKSKDAARWGIQSLPVWKGTDTTKPTGNLAQAISKKTRPSDLALLVELLECEIPETSKDWGLTILANSSKPKNTEFLQAILMEDYPEYKTPRYTNSSYSGKLKKSALEALGKTNSKSSILFLIGLYGDLSTYGNPDTIEFQKDVRENLLANVGENKDSIEALESVLENHERWTPSSLILTRQLLTNIGKKP